MIGNVMEFTADCRQGNCGTRVTRGANWSPPNTNFLVAHWGFAMPTDSRDDRIGFRVARPLE